MCFYGKIVFERVATTVNSNSIVINLDQNKLAAGLYIVYVKTKMGHAVFKIPIECIGHNVKQEGVEFFKGVVSRSNYDTDSKDVNPSFNFKLFKELLEND